MVVDDGGTGLLSQSVVRVDRTEPSFETARRTPRVFICLDGPTLYPSSARCVATRGSL